MKKKILLVGGTGMLGSTVGKYFQNLPDYDVCLTTRDLTLAYGNKGNWIKFDPTGQTIDAISHLPELFSQMPENPDYVINALGCIKPFIENNRAHSILINSLFPHELASYCRAIGVKVLHITTDCVFSGNKGNYNEKDLHDCTDFYGKTKSCGEPTNCMVVRTSIIGPEIHKNASLIAWAQSQKGKEVSGFTDALWNGITTKQYAKVCRQIIESDLHSEGIFHIFSNKVSKYELLQLINDHFRLDLKINPSMGPERCDRTLCTIRDLMFKVKISTIQEQIKEL